MLTKKKTAEIKLRDGGESIREYTGRGQMEAGFDGASQGRRQRFAPTIVIMANDYSVHKSLPLTLSLQV